MQFELKAPRVRHYIHCLGRTNYMSSMTTMTYDELSYNKIRELFDLMEKLEPVSKNGRRELWLTVDRGAIEDFGNYEEMLEDGEVTNRQDFESWWLDEYPDKIEWNLLETLHDKEIDYRAVFMNHRQILEIDSRKERYERVDYDIHEFTCWLVEAVGIAIEKLKAGTYNSEVEERLPAKHRTGTLTRKDKWDIWTNDKADFLEGLSQKDIDYFLQNAIEDISKIERRLPSVTANDFYRFCAMGYAANHYEHTKLTPIEQYKKYADGRDDGLSEINPESPEAFDYWLHSRSRRGGHPWEVCRGGNSTHVSLYISNDEKGYYICLAGSSVGRCIETIRFFIALHKAGLPVTICDAGLLCQRLLGNELIGIVPSGIMPVYCHSLFKENIITFMNLPDEDTDEFIKHISWYPLVRAQLRKSTEQEE